MKSDSERLPAALIRTALVPKIKNATFFQHVWFYSNGSGTGVGVILSGSGMGVGVILREWDRTGLIFLLRPVIGTGQDFFFGSGTGQE